MEREPCRHGAFAKASKRRSASGNFLASITNGGNMLAIAGTGYGLIGLLVIILLVVLIVYFARRA
jgi:hypothetical protein